MNLFWDFIGGEIGDRKLCFTIFEKTASLFIYLFTYRQWIPYLKSVIEN